MTLGFYIGSNEHSDVKSIPKFYNHIRIFSVIAISILNAHFK